MHIHHHNIVFTVDNSPRILSYPIRIKNIFEDDTMHFLLFSVLLYQVAESSAAYFTNFTNLRPILDQLFTRKRAELWEI